MDQHKRKKMNDKLKALRSEEEKNRLTYSRKLTMKLNKASTKNF